MLNKASIDLIKISEGCELLCYADAVGVPTIGYGHTKTLKHADIGRKRITTAEAERLLVLDLAHFEAQVAKLVAVKLTENQRGALVSWTYNLGEGNLAKSTLLNYINEGKPIADIEHSWMQWVNAGGKRLQGLVNRRAAEIKLWKTR